MRTCEMFLIVCLGIRVSTPAAADGAAAALEARAEKHFQLAEYDAAIVDFKEAFRISNAPGYLYNIAQAYRLKKDCRSASTFYKNYLRAKPDAGNASKVKERVAEMDACAATQPPPSSDPSNPTNPTTRTPEVRYQIHPTDGDFVKTAKPCGPKTQDEIFDRVLKFSPTLAVDNQSMILIVKDVKIPADEVLADIGWWHYDGKQSTKTMVVTLKPSKPSKNDRKLITIGVIRRMDDLECSERWLGTVEARHGI